MTADFKTDDKISYSVRSLAAATELSVDSINKAIKDGDLVARYFGTKPLIGRDEALRWFESLPDEKPTKTSAVV